MNGVRLAPRARLGALMAGLLLIVASILVAPVSAATGGATKLVITANSLGASHATAGASFTVDVTAEDASNATATGFTDAVVFTSSDTQAVVSPASPYTYVGGDAGVKVFTVTLRTAGSRTITFSDQTTPSVIAVTVTITVDPATPTKLAFTQQPSTSAAAVVFAVQPQVSIEDAFGNVVTSASTTVTLTLSGPTSTGAGTLINCVGGATSLGVATFAGCRVVGTVSTTGIGLGYRLNATGAYTAATSSPFDIVDSLAYDAQPSSGIGGGALSPQPAVSVRATLAGGSTKAVDDFTTTVTLSILVGTGTAGATLTCSGGLSKVVVAGAAVFSGCSIDKAGTGYRLVATSIPPYSGNSWTSSLFNVVAGPASKLTFVTQPAGAAAGQVFTTQPVVAITDAGGNVVTSGVSAYVTLMISVNPGVPAGVLTCAGLTVPTATSGINAGKAVFSGCSISTPGVGYTLLATATGVIPASTSLASAATTAFTVTQPAAVITLARSAGVITWGGTVVLTTHFAVNGAGKTFTLQGARDGINWATITTLVTDSAGNATLSYRPATNLFYRAVFAGTSDLVAGVSNTARVVVRQIALLRPTHYGATTLIRRGTKVTFTTTVRPIGPTLPAAKVSFFLYKRVGSSWVFVTRRDAYIDSLGKASYTFSFGSVGTFYVRSMANPTPFNANSVMSPAEFYRVY